MRLINSVKSLLLRRKINQINKKTPFEASIDDLLADEMKRMTQTNRTAEKILKLKLMRQENKKALDSISELDDDLDDEDDDFDEDPTWEDQIKEKLMSKLLGNFAPGGSPKETMGGDPGDPLANEEIPGDLIKAASSLTPEQMKKIKEKFGF